MTRSYVELAQSPLGIAWLLFLLFSLKNGFVVIERCPLESKKKKKNMSQKKTSTSWPPGATVGTPWQLEPGSTSRPWPIAGMP